MQRVVQPEILDTLAATDPAAIANRRDLRLYNRLMGNYRWFGNEVGACSYDRNFLELGAGDGTLGMYLHRNGKLRTTTAYTGLDLVSRPTDWPVQWSWLEEDLCQYSFAGNHNVLVANLILHQFSLEELMVLGEKLATSRLSTLLINEPVRKNLHIWQVYLSWLLRVHPITLHDAKVSVQAGFRNMELAELLGLNDQDWDIHGRETFMGANRLVCRRRS